MAIMQKLLDEPDTPLNDVVGQTYYATLHRWHGFLATSAFNVSGRPPQAHRSSLQASVHACTQHLSAWHLLGHLTSKLLRSCPLLVAPLSRLQVAFAFVPSRETFMEKVAGGSDPDALEHMRSFVGKFSPLLAEVHAFLVRWHARLLHAAMWWVSHAWRGSSVTASAQRPSPAAAVSLLQDSRGLDDPAKV